ncbi:acyltransferase 3 [Gulosibacter sp. 10]|nr:acyltransferase 3 [Gulosibacter sp. 10]
MEKVAKPGFIPEVQGLRTLALLLVVVFHIWFARVSGGVDVFLFVSAFLLTRSLTASSEAGRAPEFGRAVLRRFARLMPVAVVVIAATLLAVWLFLPRHTWGAVNWDAFYSVLYVENWRLILEQVDYYGGTDAAANPFQHFWSLSVQGQIFILWPLVHLLGFHLARRLRRGVRGVLIGLFGAVFATSFAWSVWYTAVDQRAAYFDTGARAWEFAAGSLLALVLPSLRIGPALRLLLGWLGVAMLVTCGFVLPVESTFPGFAALWPVAAGALVILAAGAPTRFGADRLLTRRWFGGLGQYSYALYLAHWPVLVLYERLARIDEPSLLDGLWIMAISAAASVLLVHLVERPAARALGRHVPTRPGGRDAAHPSKRGAAHPSGRSPGALRPPRRRDTAAATVVVCLAGGLVAAGGSELARWGLSTAATQRTEQVLLGESAVDAHLPATERAPIELGIGAEGPELDPVDDPYPGARAMEYEWSSAGSPCADHLPPPDTPGFCFETESGAADAGTVLFVGNSHAQQFSAIGYQTAALSGRLDVRLQSSPGCGLREGDLEAEGPCGETWRAALGYIGAERPEFVVVVGTMSAVAGEDEPMTGVPGWIERVRDASPETAVIVLRDNARFESAPYECGVEHGWDSPECEAPVAPPVDPAFVAEIEAAGGVWADLTEHICPEGVCRPQVGEVAVWFDDDHLTATFVKTLAQHFADAIAERVPEWPAELYARP